MESTFIQICMAVIGSVGFAMFFNINKSKIPLIAVGALISWVTYLFCFNITHNIFISNFIPAMMLSVCSEIIASLSKTPTNIFLIPSIIPLLPGSDFYYTMAAALKMNAIQFKLKGLETIVIVLSVTAGIVVGFFIFEQVSKLFNKV